jgi:anti-sigma regulatory factor (Ser/Thr protein kinase)
MSVHQQWSHEDEFAAEAISACEARAFVARHLLSHEMPGLVDDLELVVSELATNAMVHAQTPFTVILRAADNTVSLEVLDGEQAGPTLVVARELDTNGRGVAIVNALSRNWGVNARASGGKSVWAQFDAADGRQSSRLAKLRGPRQATTKMQKG